MGVTDMICLGSEPFIFLALYTLASHMSVIPQLLLLKLCLQSYNSTVCHNLDSGYWTVEENIVHQAAAEWNLYLYLAFAIPSIFSCGFLGYLYDHYMRTKLLVIVPITMALQAVVYLLSSVHMNLHVGYLVFGSCINSFCGDIQGSILLAYAYMADVTNKDERRSLRMAITESSVFLGQATGSLLSGYLLNKYGFTSVFGASLIASILNFIYVGVLILNQDAFAQAEDERYTNSKGVRHVKLFCTDIMGVNLRIFLPLLLAVAFTNMAVLGENEILVLYLKHQPLGMSSREIGLYLGILHLGRGVGAAINAFLLTKLFALSDYMLAMFGLTSLIMIHVAASLVHTKPALYLTSCLSLNVPLAMSSFRSIATKSVSEKQYGMILSLVAITSMLGLTIATVAANKLYMVTTKQYPGMALLLLASFSAIALILSGAVFVRGKIHRRIPLDSSTNEPDAYEEMALTNESVPLLNEIPNKTEK